MADLNPHGLKEATVLRSGYCLAAFPLRHGEDRAVERGSKFDLGLIPTLTQSENDGLPVISGGQAGHGSSRQIVEEVSGCR